MLRGFWRASYDKEMERLSCSARDAQLDTMKERAAAFAEADMEGRLEPLRSIDEMTLQELKLEADSMMALAMFVVTRDLGDNKGYQQAFADYLLEHTPPADTLLETVRERGRDFYAKILMGGFHRLREQPGGQPLVERLEHYREGYYRRTPSPESQEANYSGTEHLISAGINTVTDRFPHLLHGLDIAARQAGLAPDDTARLARSSDHLALVFAKLSLGDLERFTDLINDHDFLLAAAVRVAERKGEPAAYADHRLFAKMRELYPDEKPEYAHRRRQGCPASVAFDGSPSTITELWRLTVGALEKAGHWAA